MFNSVFGHALQTDSESYGSFNSRASFLLLQVGFVVRLDGGRLSEDLADFLPDYR
jgi:hypothetical protein